MSHTWGSKGDSQRSPFQPRGVGTCPLILAMARSQGQSQIDLASADIHWENCGSGDEVIAVSSKVLILQELDAITISIITWGGGEL